MRTLITCNMSARRSSAKTRRQQAEDDGSLDAAGPPPPIKVARMTVLDTLEAALVTAAAAHVDATNLNGEERAIVKTVAHQLAKSAFDAIRSNCYEDSDEPEAIDRSLARKVTDLRREAAAAADDVLSLRQQYERLLPQQLREAMKARSSEVEAAAKADIAASSAALSVKISSVPRGRTRSQLQKGLEIAVEEAEDIGASLAAQARVVDVALQEATNTVTVIDAVDRASRAPSTVEVALRTGAATLAAGAAEPRRGRGAK